MNPNRRCDTCAAFVLEPTLGKDLGQCRLSPKQVTSMVLPAPPTIDGRQGLQIQHLSSYPVQRIDAHCMQWRPRLEMTS